jgi:RNase P protein component
MSRDAKRNGTKKALLEALRLNHGNVTKACEAVGITRKYFYQYAKEDPEFKETIEEIQESSIDVVEGELFKQIKNGSTTATIFF